MNSSFLHLNLFGSPQGSAGCKKIYKVNLLDCKFSALIPYVPTYSFYCKTTYLFSDDCKSESASKKRRKSRWAPQDSENDFNTMPRYVQQGMFHLFLFFFNFKNEYLRKFVMW